MFFLHCLISLRILTTARGKREMDEIENEIKPCPVCLTPNDISATFCEECGSPFGSPSMINPTRVVQADGLHTKKRIINGEKIPRTPRKIVLFTSWLLGLPAILVTSVVIILLVFSSKISFENWFQNFFFISSGIAIDYIFIILLYATTRYYLKLSRLQKIRISEEKSKKINEFSRRRAVQYRNRKFRNSAGENSTK